MTYMWTNTTEMELDLKSFMDTQHDSNDSGVGVPDVTSLRLISDKDRYLIVFILSCFLGIPTCVVGIIGNVINIVVFIRQGFADSINISLLCLSISDLGSLVTLLWRNILYLPPVLESDLPWDPVSIIYLTAGTPHVTLFRISGCITVFIAIERCICIAFPLKVKQIFTHSRTRLINAAIYVVTIAAAIPIFYTNRISWVFYPDRNRTLLGLTFVDNHAEIERVTFILNGIVLPFTSLFLELVCTIVMVAKLQSQTKWRQSMASSVSETVDTSKKDMRVMKMVLILTVIFIVCSLPINFNYVCMLVDTNINATGKYANAMMVSASVAFFCEAINSSLNHFVYVRMSSKFKSTYQALFPWCKDKATSKTN